MAAIDDLLASTLISQITTRLPMVGKAGVRIPFSSIELASEVEFGTEVEVTSLISSLATAKGWTINVDFMNGAVIINA